MITAAATANHPTLFESFRLLAALFMYIYGWGLIIGKRGLDLPKSKANWVFVGVVVILAGWVVVSP